jgi:hypothetical protein
LAWLKTIGIASGKYDLDSGRINSRSFNKICCKLAYCQDTAGSLQGESWLWRLRSHRM